MFENYRVFKTDGGKPISFEVGKMCGLSMAPAWCVMEKPLYCVTLPHPKASRQDRLFPLSVDFEEKLYSVGKIPRLFFEKEGRPSEKAILASRMVDRPIRPLFPKDMRNDVLVVMTVMSVDLTASPR